MKRLSTFVFIVIFSFTQTVFAETTVSSGSPTSSGGTNDVAKKSASTANITMAINGVAATAFFVKATAAPPPKKPIYYALAAAAVAAGLVMGGGASNAGSVDDVTLAVPNLGGIGGGSGIPGAGAISGGAGFGTGDGIEGQLQDLQQQLAGAGYSLSADGSTLSTPNGPVSMEDIASGNAPGFEMTPDVRAEMAKIEAEAMKKASGNKVVAIGLQDGGGGGSNSGMGSGSEEASNRFDMAAYLKSLKNRDPSSVTGLSKKLGEDNIGIKSDNIFEMVSRQYKRKQSQSAFMK